MKHPATPPKECPEGYFTRFIRLHNWPPGFVSHLETSRFTDAARSEAATRGRATMLARGQTGSIPGISKKADDQVDRSRAVVARSRK